MKQSSWQMAMKEAKFKVDVRKNISMILENDVTSFWESHIYDQH